MRAVIGEVFDVAVDLRPDSPTFGRWVGEVLSEDNFRQLYVPPGFAHGFCVLSDTAQVEYKCTDLYDPAGRDRPRLGRPRGRDRAGRGYASCSTTATAPGRASPSCGRGSPPTAA